MFKESEKYSENQKLITLHFVSFSFFKYFVIFLWFGLFKKIFVSKIIEEKNSEHMSKN